MVFICKEMDISTDEFKKLMRGKNKTYKDYKNGYTLIHAARNLVKLVGIEERNIK